MPQQAISASYAAENTANNLFAICGPFLLTEMLRARRELPARWRNEAASLIAITQAARCHAAGGIVKRPAIRRLVSPSSSK